MDSRRLLTIIGLSLVSSMLLVPALEQALAFSELCFAKHLPLSDCNLYQHRVPPIGSVYVVNVSGTAHIPTQKIGEPMSANIQLNVTAVKGKVLKIVSLKVVKGDLKVGDNTYSLSKGIASLTAGYLNIRATSADGTKILMVYASLTQSLPIWKGEHPVGLLHATGEKSITIKIITESWFLNNFGGSIGRIA